MTNSARILVVDDAPQVRRRPASHSHSRGLHTTFEARDGEEAIERFAEEPYDIILLDVNMPRMDGLQVCRAIRGKSDVPMIMLTVREAERDKVLALDAGADDYVMKPFGMQGAACPHSCCASKNVATGQASSIRFQRSEH